MRRHLINEKRLGRILADESQSSDQCAIEARRCRRGHKCIALPDDILQTSQAQVSKILITAIQKVLHGQPNAWVADFNDPAPSLTLSWPAPQTIGRMEISFDTDFDHAMESVQWGHPERAMPFCVKHYRVLDSKGKLLAECKENHHTRQQIVFSPAIPAERLTIECVASNGPTPASLMEVRCYES